MESHSVGIARPGIGEASSEASSTPLRAHASHLWRYVKLPARPRGVIVHGIARPVPASDG